MVMEKFTITEGIRLQIDSSESHVSFARELKAQFYRGNRAAFFMSLATTVILSLVNLFVSYLMQVIIDIVSGTETRWNLMQVTVMVAITLGVLVASLLIERQVFPKFLKQAMQQYKDHAFTEITKKNLHSFQSENSSTYLSAFSNDIASIETNYLGKIFSLVMQIIMFIGAFAMMILYHPLLTLIAFLLAVFPVLASLATGNRMAQAELAVSERNASFVGLVKDILGGFSVIKSFRVEKEIQSNFAAINEKVEEAKRTRKQVEILIQLIGSVAGIVAQIGVFLAGAYLALTGRGVTAGVVIVFVQLMNFVITPIAQVPQILANRKAANALIDKLARAISTNFRDGGDPVAPRLDQAIELDRISFGYEADHRILHDVSCRFESGKSYAIVGASGSGKSTLLNLLMGSSGTYEGEIRFDQKELRSIETESLYGIVSIIQQNVFIFNDSIRNNITMYHEFPEEKINVAVRMSGLADLIQEKTWEYPCGENGSGLSGGERQRVSIARCLLRETPVLLVDEATAALDPVTSFGISNSILDLQDLTRIVVTHELDEQLLSRYDSILVLRQGRLEEVGSFADLMASRQYFYSLFNVAQNAADEPLKKDEMPVPHS